MFFAVADFLLLCYCCYIFFYWIVFIVVAFCLVLFFVVALDVHAHNISVSF